jgi:hypothetical protein
MQQRRAISAARFIALRRVSTLRAAVIREGPIEDGPQPSAREIEHYFLAAEHRPSIFFTAETRIR